MWGKERDPVPRRDGRFCSYELKLAVAKAYKNKQGTAAELGKVFGVSPVRIYKWARICQEKGEKGLEDLCTPRKRDSKPVDPRIAKEILETKWTVAKGMKVYLIGFLDDYS